MRKVIEGNAVADLAFLAAQQLVQNKRLEMDALEEGRRGHLPGVVRGSGQLLQLQL